MSERTSEKPFVAHEPEPPGPDAARHEPVLVQVHAAVGREVRCPFCHDAVASEHERWVSCESCHAVHHRACWIEGRCCATCRATLSSPRISSRRAHVLLGLAFLLPLLGLGAWKTFESYERFHRQRVAAAQKRADFHARLWHDPSNAFKKQAPLDALTEAIHEAPDSSRAWADRGLARRNAKDWAGAAYDFDQAIELAPNESWLYVHRGGVRENLPDLDGARADDERAVELDPSSFWAWNNRGWVRVNQGDHAGGRADLTRALELDETHAFTWSKRAEAREHTGDLAGAIADYGRAIVLEPRDAHTRLERGRLLLESWHGAEALPELVLATELAPGNPLAWSLRGRAHTRVALDSSVRPVKQSELNLAIAALTRAIELEPRAASHRVDRAAALRLAGDLKRAVADLKHGLEVASHVEGYSPLPERTRASESEGDLEAAYQDYSSRLCSAVPR